MTYVTGMVAAVPRDNKDAYIDMCNKLWTQFKEDGALGGADTWGNDVPDGEVTSFPMAVKAGEGEVVCFSWILWPDKATADACWVKMETEERWTSIFAEGMPMDGKRMIFGGFDQVAGF